MKLVINADDAGVDNSRNCGIFEAFDNGLVSSVTVFVKQRGWEGVLKNIKKRDNLGVGLHFNITTGKPLVKDHKSLVDKNGIFLEKGEIYKRAMNGLLEKDEIKRELAFQIFALKDEGIDISHIDSHHHVHILPVVRDAVAEIVPKGTWVRIPLEKNAKSVKPSIDQCLILYDNPEILVNTLNYFSEEAKKAWKDKFLYTDDFCGSRISFKPSLEGFINAVSDLSGNFCELMVHPGSEPDEDSAGFSRLKQRQDERDILTSEEFKTFIAKNSIEVVSYKN